MRRLVYALRLLAPALLPHGEGPVPSHAGLAARGPGAADEAARLLRAAADEAPADAEVHYALALALAEGQPPDERGVARHLDAALRLDPDDARFLEAKLAALCRVLPEDRAF